MNHFFAYLYRLRYIQRWSLMRNTVRDNVAEHSYYVALIAHALGTIARNVFGKTHIDPTQLAVQALFHDATEVFTGDIPTPVKHHNADLLHNFREIERLSSERLIGLTPDVLRPSYAPLLQTKTSPANDVVLHYVKAADLLDAYLKCRAERSSGNREFIHAEEQILAHLDALQLVEVSYFLTHLAPSVEKTLDELGG
jgi:5'-deoxynucleotidase